MKRDDLAKGKRYRWVGAWLLVSNAAAIWAAIAVYDAATNIDVLFAAACLGGPWCLCWGDPFGAESVFGLCLGVPPLLLLYSWAKHGGWWKLLLVLPLWFPGGWLFMLRVML